MGQEEEEGAASDEAAVKSPLCTRTRNTTAANTCTRGQQHLGERGNRGWGTHTVSHPGSGRGWIPADKIYPICCCWLFFFCFVFVFKKRTTAKIKQNCKIRSGCLYAMYKNTGAVSHLGWASARLYFPGDLGPLPSDGVFHGLQLLQQFLPS